MNNKTSAAKLAADRRYIKKNLKRFNLDVNSKTEPEILEKLQACPKGSMQGYVKELILSDIFNPTRITRYEQTLVQVGIIKIDGLVQISDSGFNKDFISIKVVPGTYNNYVTVASNDKHSFISEVSIEIDSSEDLTESEFIGIVTIDTGLCTIFKEDISFSKVSWSGIVTMLYGASTNQYIMTPWGVVARAGIDGDYKIYCKRNNEGIIAHLSVSFTA